MFLHRGLQLTSKFDQRCTVLMSSLQMTYHQMPMPNHWATGLSQNRRHCVIYGVESLSGVLEWSHGVEFWSGFWSGMESDFEFLSPF